MLLRSALCILLSLLGCSSMQYRTPEQELERLKVEKLSGDQGYSCRPVSSNSTSCASYVGASIVTWTCTTKPGEHSFCTAER